MTQPTAQIVMRNRAAVAEELRRLLPKMEGVRAARPIPFGLAAIDCHLPQGGLVCGALHEIVPEAGATPAAFGFLVALLARLSRTHPLFLVLPAYGLRDYGRPYGHGIRALGLDPSRLILAETAHRKELALGHGRSAALARAGCGRRHHRSARSENQSKAASRRRRLRSAALAAAAGPLPTLPRMRGRVGRGKRRDDALAGRPGARRARPLRPDHARALAAHARVLPQRTHRGMDGGVRSCRASFQSGCRAGRS